MFSLSIDYTLFPSKRFIASTVNICYICFSLNFHCPWAGYVLKTYKKVSKTTLNNYLFLGRYLTVFLTTGLAIILSIIANINDARAYQPSFIGYDFNKEISNLYIPAPSRDTSTIAQETLAVYQNEQAAIEARRKSLEDKINRTLAYLKRVGSPVANEEIATMIVDLSDANNADYRVLLAIMTIESGSCRQSFSYNCFGYLNGVKYTSFQAAFQDLVPKVSRQYAAKYGWDFVALSRAYGQHNWELHSKNMLKVANSI